LSGLSRLYKYTGDGDLIKAAQNLLDSVLTGPLVPGNNGILVETCDATGTCNQDQWMFKGVFFEHLGYFLTDITAMQELNSSTRKALLLKYKDFIQANAGAVWGVSQRDGSKVQTWWANPAGSQNQGQVSVESQGSGVAAISSAVRLNGLLESVQ
jgi:Glycosyl hydrolase family 76